MDNPQQTPAPTTAPAVSQAPDPTQLAAELVRSRFDAAAARAGLEDDYGEIVAAQASKWCEAQKLEPTRDNFGRFLDELKGKKPKLFAAPAAAASSPTLPNTAPVVPGAPAAPAPTAVHTPYTQWRALVEAGRKAEAEAFYRQNRRAINRSA